MNTLSVDIAGVMAKSIGAEHGITADEWTSCTRRLVKVHAALLARWDRGELGFAQLPFDATLTDQVLAVAAQVRYRFQNLVVLGIGGSSLGARAATHALCNPVEMLPTRLERRGTPRLFVCDNIDPDQFGALGSQLAWRDSRDRCPMDHLAGPAGKTVRFI
ncbi:MAG: hypothetical protein HYV03_07850 [Deltaproteobacteria bacterium]|nr:hypothetical protein [Deltaproteobacteria bacterium]